MLIIPAIDIYEGKAVRLEQGDFSRMTIYDNKPWKVARLFAEAGCSLVHVVDLEGAKHGAFRNYDVIKKIVSENQVHVQAGGGVRSKEDVSRLFDAGVERVVIGSVAVKEPGKIGQWVELFGYNRIVIAIDIRNGRIAHSGWTESAKGEPLRIMKRLGRLGASIFLCTDISKDGMLEGPNVSLYKKVCKHFPDYEIIASGGVSSNGDLERLRKTGVSGAIVGKALYEGKIKLSEE
jgi:phosphoribosylformimino-5-aminoimidazole carboxamide ribotide isomerase